MPDPRRRAPGGLVLLDTNAVLLPFRATFPLVDEIHRHAPGARIAVPRSVLSELERLANRRLAHADAARTFARRFPTVESEGRGDSGLLAIAVRRRAWVVTADRELRGRLRAAGVVVLAPRGSVRLARWEPTRALVPGASPPRRATVKNRPPLASRPPRRRGHAARRRRAAE